MKLVPAIILLMLASPVFAQNAADEVYDPAVMADALRQMPRQGKPSDVVVPGLLEGLVNVGRLIEPFLDRHAEKPEVERPTVLANRV